MKNSINSSQYQRFTESSEEFDSDSSYTRSQSLNSKLDYKPATHKKKKRNRFNLPKIEKNTRGSKERNRKRGKRYDNSGEDIRARSHNFERPHHRKNKKTPRYHIFFNNSLDIKKN